MRKDNWFATLIVKVSGFITILIFVSIIVLAIMAARGCTPQVESQEPIEPKHFTMIFEDRRGDYDFCIEFRDNDTGVHYLMTDEFATPMYNSDGTLKTSK